MEVLVGSTFVSTPAACVRDRHDVVSVSLGAGNGIEKVRAPVPEVSSENSSTIGAPGNSDDEEEDDDVSSNLNGGFTCLASLEDALPIKRGLSKHYAGKSKSFVNLSEVDGSLKDIEKPESPVNKRRRLLLASSLSRKSRKSFYSCNPQSVPHFCFNEEKYDEMTSSSTSSSSSLSSSSSVD